MQATWSLLLLAAMFHSRKDNGRLFDAQIILYGSSTFDTPYDLTRFNEGVLRANPAPQYDNAITGFNADIE